MCAVQGGTQYLCNHLKQQTGAPVCQRIPGDAIDDQVVSWFFEALSVAEIDVAREALSTADTEYEKLLAARRQQVARLRYLAQLAERQFIQSEVSCLKFPMSNRTCESSLLVPLTIVGGQRQIREGLDRNVARFASNRHSNPTRQRGIGAKTSPSSLLAGSLPSSGSVDASVAPLFAVVVS